MKYQEQDIFGKNDEVVLQSGGHFAAPLPSIAAEKKV